MQALSSTMLDKLPQCKGTPAWGVKETDLLHKDAMGTRSERYEHTKHSISLLGDMEVRAVNMGARGLCTVSDQDGPAVYCFTVCYSVTVLGQ